jgi:hypothetical protein
MADETQKALEDRPLAQQAESPSAVRRVLFERSSSSSSTSTITCARFLESSRPARRGVEIRPTPAVASCEHLRKAV